MLYVAAARRTSILRRQSTKRSFSAHNNQRNSRLNSSLLNARPSTANNFRRARPSTPYKSESADRVKELETTFFLTEHEVYDFYRAFCSMAKKKVPTLSQALKSKKKSKMNSNEIELATPTDMAVELSTDARSSARPWENKQFNVTLSLKAFFAVFDLPNGGFYDAIFELVGIKNFHSMTFR